MTVRGFDLALLTFDANAKYRGFGINHEFFLRWIYGFEASGPVPEESLYDWGYCTELGYFLIPQRFELGGRISQVTGLFGTATELAAVVNWYPKGTTSLKLNFEIRSLDHNPAEITGANLRAGETGIMYLTQLIATF